MANGWKGFYPKKDLKLHNKNLNNDKKYSEELKDEIFNELQSD